MKSDFDFRFTIRRESTRLLGNRYSRLGKLSGLLAVAGFVFLQADQQAWSQGAGNAYNTYNQAAQYGNSGGAASGGQSQQPSSYPGYPSGGPSGSGQQSSSGQSGSSGGYPGMSDFGDGYGQPQGGGSEEYYGNPFGPQGGPGGPGGPSPSSNAPRRSGPPGNASASFLGGAFANPLAGLFASTDLTSLGAQANAPPVNAGPVLSREARAAYSKGDFSLAMDLYYGHMVAEYEHAGEAIRSVRFNNLMKRPAWQLRWGVSFAVRGEATDPQPIQDGGSSQNRSGRSGGGQPGYPGQMSPDDYGEGDFAGGGPGADLYGEGDDGDGGEMEEEAYPGMNGDIYGGAGPQGGGGNRRPAQQPGPQSATERFAAMERPMLSPEADSELNRVLGLVAKWVGEQLDSRISQGDFGMTMIDVSDSLEGNVSDELVELIQGVNEPLPLWRPGVFFLGEGDYKNNLVVAAQNDIDLVLHFDVLLKPTRGDFTQNVARCKLLHVPTGKSLGISKVIDSLEYAQKSRARDLDARDYVSEQVSNLLAIVDREAKSSAMPTLTTEIARRRIGALMASGGEKSLRTLAEVRLYQAQNLLDEDDVIAAFDIVGGEEGLKILYGSEEERLNTVRKWAAEANQKSGSDS